MLTPVVPSEPKPAGGGAPTRSLLQRNQPRSIRFVETDGLTEGPSAERLETKLAGLKRENSIHQVRPGLTFRRNARGSTRRLNKRDVPPHLLKFLQRTPEQQHRVDIVKAILVDSPTARNELSLDVVYDWMLQNCKQYSNNIFGSAPEYIRREICRQMRLMRVPSQNLIIRQGDTGDRCYIVIDGIVDVYIIKEKPTAVPESEEPFLTRAARSATEKLLNPMAEYGEQVANLGPGAMFGEVVLLNPSARRNATIVASQYCDTCDLICLERSDYIRLVRTASMEASHYNYAEILDQMYLFQGWDKHEKMRLVSAMRAASYLSNEYLYRAGTDAKWLFIITSGEVVERVNLTLPNKDLAAGTKAPEKKVSVEFALVGPGDIVGEWPFVRNKWGASFDLKAVTDVETLAIDRRFYDTMIANATPDSSRAVYMTLQKLQRQCQEREEWRQQRVECGEAYPNAHISMY
ncbi:TPA: hypothetical protein N0F65_012994 [Lagenidium giganteum]|uniref:Cyclic nucleotide-binding domain-containing protein n=1 Tax=Lagenidium giganteum TaxID=4803 RepID=A0AAV2YI47_9STRA|nr:TPA: hypothetical protein N0F65_012994 [Lagenidium giganteum]